MLYELLAAGELLAYARDLAPDNLHFSDGGAAFYSQMYDAMSAALEREPQNPQVWFLRGVAAQGNHWYEESLQDLSEAIHLDPHHAKAYLLRSEVLASLGRYDMARTDRQKALALDPKVVQ